MIQARYTFLCSGCDAKVAVEAGRVERRFVSVSGRDYGIGAWVTKPPDPNATMPEGWSWDLYTSALYCRDCMEEIYGEDSPDDPSPGTEG